MEDNLNFIKMEDDLNLFPNGRRPHFIKNERCPQFLKMEDNLNFFKNETQPQYFQKWKTTSIFFKMEDNRKAKTYIRIGSAL
jgi:hypothetical protein